MQREFRDIVFEFAKPVSDIESVIQIILFGSVSREEADIRSDVDFFIILQKKDKRTIKQIQNIAYELEKNYDRSIQITFSDRKFGGFDETFLEEIFKEGIILFSKIPVIRIEKLKLSPHTIFSFSLENLTQGEKMKIKRALYGSKSYSRYRKKIYKTKIEGLIYKENRLGRGALIVEKKRAKIIENLFKKSKVNFKKIDIWK